MKQILLPIFIVLSFLAKAQKQTNYYNYAWKACEAGKASFVSIVEKKDSGYWRNDFYISTTTLQMQGLYKDSACKIRNGNFIYFYPNNNISSIGKFVNDEREGTWLLFYNNGIMQDSTNYENGTEVGISYGWHENGNIRDSINNDIGNNKSSEVYWFDDGVPSAAGIKFYGKKVGKWQYFHKNGNSAAIEIYSQNVLLDKSYFDEKGKAIADTTSTDRDAMIKGGLQKWKKFLMGNLEFPANYKLVNTDVVTVVVAATIDEEGNVLDVHIDTPFNPVFDKEAVRVMKKSPKWLPKIEHNRRVKAYVRQPISFAQAQ
jgi:TonB family protein